MVSGNTLQLHSKAIDIKAPHFVFRVQDYIEQHPEFSELGITPEMLTQGGLTIQTSLDYTLQQFAEKTVTEYRSLAEKYGANNRAFLYADTTNGDILAYVGSLDFNDKTIDGKVDMIQAPRQP